MGAGAFEDWRHFLWIALTIGLCVGLYILFAKYKKAGKITVITMAIGMFLVRLVNQTVRAIIGAEVPWTRAFPFHLCTVMTFLLPIIVLLSYYKPQNKTISLFKHAIYVLSILGGIITVIVGDFFDSSFMNFGTIEGIVAHTVMILIPIIEIAIGNFRLDIKTSWTVIVGMLVLIGWASLANFVFFKDYDTNYMFLRKNGLPGNIGGDAYFLIYILIFAIMFSLIYFIPICYRKIKNKKTVGKIETKS